MPRRRVAHHAVLVALAGLIPFPFVDTWIQRRLRAELVAQLGRHHDQPLDATQVRTLSADRANLLLGCVVGVVWWPIKKLFRKIIYVLTIKDAIDAASDTWLQGEMVGRALRAGALPEQAEGVRTAMDAAMKTHARSPLWGPRKKVNGSLTEPEDSVTIKVVASVAQRGGGLAVLEEFDRALALLLADHPDRD